MAFRPSVKCVVLLICSVLLVALLVKIKSRTDLEWRDCAEATLAVPGDKYRPLSILHMTSRNAISNAYGVLSSAETIPLRARRGKSMLRLPGINKSFPDASDSNTEQGATVFSGPRVRLRGAGQALPSNVTDAPPPLSIPHIIHQTWNTADIPLAFKSWVTSWMRRHRTWEYWLWTPDDVMALLTARYPDHVEMYARYTTVAHRSDAMRYFVLYSFGGVYADLDTECLKPLDALVGPSRCVLSEETYEHAHLLYNRDPANVMTTIMACRHGHPLFKQAIDNLRRYQEKFGADFIKATGPFFLDAVFRNYTSVTHAPPDDVTVLPPDYLLPTYDPGQQNELSRICDGDRNVQTRPAYFLDTCEHFVKDRIENNIPSDMSYTDHHWLHMYMKETSWNKQPSMNIYKVFNSSFNTS